MRSLSSEYCENIINEFCSNTEEFSMFDRKYKRYILFEKDKKKQLWLWEHIDKLIKLNLGPDYRLSTWLIGLRYDKGDYFKEHQDSYNNKKDRLLSGGIELSDKAYYKGGEYQLEGKSVISKRGDRKSVLFLSTGKYFITLLACVKRLLLCDGCFFINT